MGEQKSYVCIITNGFHTKSEKESMHEKFIMVRRIHIDFVNFLGSMNGYTSDIVAYIKQVYFSLFYVSSGKLCKNFNLVLFGTVSFRLFLHATSLKVDLHGGVLSLSKLELKSFKHVQKCGLLFQL